MKGVLDCMEAFSIKCHGGKLVNASTDMMKLQFWPQAGRKDLGVLNSMLSPGFFPDAQIC